MDSAFQCLTSLHVLCLRGYKIPSPLGYRPLTILPVVPCCNASCISSCPVSSLLWTSTSFAILLPKDMLAKTCCHCTHKDRNCIGFDIPRTWCHVFVCLVSYRKSHVSAVQALPGTVHHCLVGYLCLCYQKEVGDENGCRRQNEVKQ